MPQEICSRCQRPADEIFIIDELPVCARCLYGAAEPFRIYPIGVVRNNLSRAASDFGVAGAHGISRLELLESQRPFLYRIEDESHLTIVYYLHASRPIRSAMAMG